MSFYDWLEEQEKKKKKTVQDTTKTTTNQKEEKESFADWCDRNGYTLPGEEDKEDSLLDDIAPVADDKKESITPVVDDEKKSKWYQGWFSGGAFSDGFDALDIPKTILGTAADLHQNMLAGVFGLAESAIDTGASLVSGGSRLVGADNVADSVEGFIKKDIINEEKVAEYASLVNGISLPNYILSGGKLGTADENSLLGEKTDSLTQSGGQLLAQIGLQSVGVPWFVTSGVSSFGGEMENSLNQGATTGEAFGSSVISMGAEILSEKLFGGSGLGEKGLVNVDKLTKGIANKTVKALTDYGIDVVGEGFEEVASSVFQNLGSALYREENLGEILFSEDAVNEYIESFIGGSVLGGVMNVGNVRKSVKTGRDYRSGLTENEQKVVDKEYENRLKDKESGGEELTKKEKEKLYDEVLKDLEKGYIGTDTIESVLGGDSYKGYQSMVEEESSLKKELDALEDIPESQLTTKQRNRMNEINTRLGEIDTKTAKSNLFTEVEKLTTNDTKLRESYNERARASEDFKADFGKFKGTKHEDAAKKTIENAVKAGANNTNAVHDLVDMTAKLSSETGHIFDFKSNEDIKNDFIARQTKEIAKLEAIENRTAEQNEYLAEMKDQLAKVKSGKLTVNGDITGNGIVLNIDSAKPLNRITGHEVTHSLEKAKSYDALRDAIFAYAKSKGVDTDAQIKALEQKYRGVKNANPEAELVADLVGDYLFTDSDFINNLSTSNRNLAQRIYDEIKHLCKLATAGSKELRELERVKHNFENAFREAEKAQKAKTNESKHSLSETTDGRLVAVVDSDILSNIDTSSWDKAKKDAAKKAAVDALKQFSDGIVVDGITRKVNQTSRKEYTRSKYTEGLYNLAPDVFADKMRASEVVDDIVVATTNWDRDGGLKHPRSDNFVDFDHGTTLIMSGNAMYSAEVVVGITNKGDAVFYDIVDMTPTTFDIKKVESPTTATTQNAIGDINGDSNANTVAQQSSDVNTQFSLSDSVDNEQNLAYNGTRGESYARTDEFRSLQAESQRMSYEDTQLYWSGSRKIDDGLRERLSRSVKQILLDSGYDGRSNDSRLLSVSHNGNQFNLHKNVNADLFHDVFEISRKHLQFGELVDLHGVETTEDHGIGYKYCDNYLSEDGLSGFSITPDGDLISVFNASGKKGFLRAIAPYVKENAKTLDCYISPKQNLQGMYESIFGFKTASVMDHNELFDHDDIAKNHNEPKVAFMVNTDSDVEVREFTKDQYDEAFDYRNSFVEQAADNEAASFMPETDDIAPTKYSLNDSNYMDAVNRGDTETAQKMVDEAAKKAGYVARVFHGTEKFGFTKFDTSFSDDKITVFATSSNELAKTYSGIGGKRGISDSLDAVKSNEYVAEKIKSMQDKLQGKIGTFVSEADKSLGKNGYVKTDDISSVMNQYAEAVSQGKMSEDRAEKKVEKHIQKMLKNGYDASLHDGESFKNWEKTDDYSQLMYKAQNAFTTAMWVAKNTTKSLNVGNYDLYANTEGLLEIDGNGVNWNELQSDILPGATSEEYKKYNNRKDGKWTTRTISKYALDNGYKGVLFKNIYDVGGKLHDFDESSKPADVYAFFHPESQLKSADPVTYDNKGKVIPLSQRFNAENNDVRYSLSDSQGNQLSPAVQKRFANSKVVDENGDLKVVYHGTPNGKFTVFDKTKGSVEGDFGSGFYFTDSESDVSRNYEGGGPDFENKVARRADQIKDEAEDEYISYEEAEARAREELYVGDHKFEVYLNIENPAVVGETTLFNYESFAEEYDRNDYDSDEDYESDVEYLIADKIDEIIWEVEKNVDCNTDGLAEVLWNAVNEGGIDVEQLKKNINELYLEDSNGNLAGNEVTRQIIESLGYDGIIDKTVSSKFNMGLSEDTTHYIVFKPNQIKNVSNENPTDDPDINRSLSNDGEDIAPIGNYDFYGKDFRKKSADGVAPVAENAPVAETADIAPVRTELAMQGEQQSIDGFEQQGKPKRTTRAKLHSQIVNNMRSVFASKGLDFDKILDNAHRMNAFAINDNTPQRVNDKTFGYEAGEALNDLTFNKVALNETEGVKWLNEQVKTIRDLSKKYKIKPGSKESSAAQMYAEGFYVNKNNEIVTYGDAELAQDFPDANVQKRIKALASDPTVRQIYDNTLKAINESRTRNAYPEIPRLDNYFLHFRAMDDTFSRLGVPFNPNDIKAKDLPTDINGTTVDRKPGQPFFTSAFHREGKRTSFDLLGGIEKYLNSAKNQIYHIDDIQTARALWTHIADRYGQAHGLENLDSMELEAQAEHIQKVYDGHLSNYARFLNEYANNLAGKTALIDRGVEGAIDRRALQFINTINAQVGKNQVGYNVSSSLTNFIPTMEAIARTPKQDSVKAFAQTVANVFHKDGFVENDPALVRRKGADKFSKTAWEKASDPGYALMSAVDNISSEFIVRTKYNELTRKGMDSEQAHIKAGEWAMRVMADRSYGQMPMFYNSKTLGLLTKYQLEVRNMLDSQFYDVAQEAKASTKDIENQKLRNAKTAANIASKTAQIAVLNHIFGQAFEQVAGYNPAFDIISTISTLFGWDDDDEEDTFGDNAEQAFKELIGDLPYISTFTGGGRIPVSDALPIGQLIDGVDQYGNEKSRLETIGEALPYYLMPGGYGQIKKTTQGLGMFSNDLPVPGSYTDSGNLRFPVEKNLGNVLQAGVFGQYASENARAYFDNERSPLEKKQIQEYIDVDIPIRDYWDYREGLAKYKKTEDKLNYIAGLDLPTEKKNILANNATGRKDPIDMESYNDFSSLDEFDFATKNPGKYAVSQVVGDYSTYSGYKDYINDLEADKDEDGKSINGSKKQKVAEYINGLPLDYGQKIILFKSQYKADDSYNRDILEYLNSREDISYEQMVEILTELGFTVQGNNVYWD